MDYWEYEIRSLVNTASVSVGIGKIQLCHYNLVWGMLRRNLYFCTKDVRETAYLSLVRPILE
jgi:hypothetical protein